MRSVSAAAAAVVVLSLLSPGRIVAQSQPSLSGKWAMVTTSSPYPQLEASSLAIVHEGTAIRITETDGLTLVFRLDGSDSRNTYKTAGGHAVEMVSKARWIGSTLVVASVVDTGNGAPYVTTRRLSLSDSGQLVVESINLQKTSGKPLALTTTSYRKG